MLNDFLQLFGKLYPCTTCGRHFREMIGRSPPPVTGTRVDFEMWLCEVRFANFQESNRGWTEECGRTIFALPFWGLTFLRGTMK
jgi:hypothetical protein